jgi:GntR family transcriptional regulator, transcriptional repressor for pyruvate dehydrogenase complex
MTDLDPVPALARMERRREPISSEVAQLLVEHLLGGSYSPGQRLPSERALAESMGVGRSVIREALKSLTLLGLVEVRQGDGTYLQSRASELLPVSFEWGLLLGTHQLHDTIEARMELEVVLAGLAAERRTEQDVREVGELLARMRDAQNNTASFVSADVAFHLRIAKAANNSILEQMLVSIQSLLRSWITRVRDANTDHGPSYLDHVPIHAAIERGDVAAAQEAMRSHLTNAGERLKGVIGLSGRVEPGGQISVQAAE